MKKVKRVRISFLQHDKGSLTGHWGGCQGGLGAQEDAMLGSLGGGDSLQLEIMIQELLVWRPS